jgi:hypothetical protein
VIAVLPIFAERLAAVSFDGVGGPRGELPPVAKN